MVKLIRRLIIVHVPMLVLLGIAMFVPNGRTTVRDFDSLIAGVILIDLVFFIAVFRGKRKGTLGTGPFDIIFVVWLLMIAWELCTSKLNVAHPALVPCPENVFDTFRVQWKTMLVNIAYSMELLLIGFFTGMILAVFLGMVAGWIPRIKAFAYPIANVMAPIPAIVISPYLVALMPTFRSASVVVIVLGIFWPTFLNTVNRVSNMDRNLLDSALMLSPSNLTMIFKVLLPYLLPGIVQGLKVSMTTSMLMLNFAELMGATHGMGYYVQNSISYANYTHAVAGIIVIGIVVTILNFLVSFVQKHALKWC